MEWLLNCLEHTVNFLFVSYPCLPSQVKNCWTVLNTQSVFSLWVIHASPLTITIPSFLILPQSDIIKPPVTKYVLKIIVKHNFKNPMVDYITILLMLWYKTILFLLIDVCLLRGTAVHTETQPRTHFCPCPTTKTKQLWEKHSTSKLNEGQLK